MGQNEQESLDVHFEHFVYQLEIASNMSQSRIPLTADSTEIL